MHAQEQRMYKSHFYWWSQAFTKTLRIYPTNKMKTLFTKTDATLVLQCLSRRFWGHF